MKKLLKFFVFILIFMISVILYARYVGTFGFDVNEYAIYNKDIPSSFDGIKVVHFSDIHYNRAINEDKVNSIVEEINLINPDIVVFTGDLIDKDALLTESDYTYLTESFSSIDAKYGKYSVLGNHDHLNMEKVVKIFNNSGFKYLENNFDIIYNEYGEKIFIGGLGNVTYNLDDVDKTMEYFKNNDDILYKLILVHEPDISDTIVDKYDVDLILAGHSHNGQVRLPVIGAIYTPEHSKKYYDKYYNINDTDLYISSGIGVSIINYRLFNRPSINFYRINKN